MAKKKSLNWQMNERMQKMFCVGESRHQAKKEYKEMRGDGYTGLKTVGIHSYGTYESYKAVSKGFIAYMRSNEPQVKYLKEITPEMGSDYIKARAGMGLSKATIGQDMAAINKLFNWEHTRKGLDIKTNGPEDKDRAWSKEEYKSFIEVAHRYNRPDIACIAILAREVGLRVHEAIEMTHSVVSRGIDTGILKVTGKGGKVRYVPLRDGVKQDLIQYQEKHKITSSRVFGRKSIKKDIKSIQNFIANHRDKFQLPETESNRSVHGLRHAYAREEYLKRIENNKSEFEARKEVSKLLGHERDEVTKTYL